VKILGVGVDLVEVDRIERSLERFGERFLRRIFTEDERKVAMGRRNISEYLALRFAAKEAVMKALGYGWTSGIHWRDIECVNDGSSPKINLYGRAREIAEGMNYLNLMTTTSHTENYAVCYVIIIG